MKNKLKTIGILFCGAIIYTIIFQIFYTWLKYDTIFFPFHVLAMSFLFNVIPILILVFSNYVILWKFPQVKNIFLGYLIHLTLSMSILVILNMGFQLCTGTEVAWAGTIFSNILIFIGMEALYHQNVSIRIFRQHALTKQQLLQYQYEVLKAQVNPHFLFNSFNILYSFIPPEEDQAREYVLNLSLIYRYTIKHGNKSQVYVKDELELFEAYSAILKIRYHNNFQVDVRGISSFMDRLIIPYSLQLLIENVTKHNIISSAYPMTVTIVADEKGITVSNPIRKKEVDVGTLFGLQYLSRLYACYGHQFVTTNDNLNYTAFIPYISTK